MDLMYLPDSIAYTTRMGWNRHDQDWVNINAKPEKPRKENATQCTVAEKNCSICKSRQKRTLSTYIRKARKDSDKDVCIEENEEEEEESQATKTVQKS